MGPRDDRLGAAAGDPLRPLTADAPQWVWRSFSYEPRRWAAALRDALLTRPMRMRSEAYLLTRQSTDLVKLRQDRVDVKRFLVADASRLERWQPLREAILPLPPGVVAELCAIWRCEAPEECPTVVGMDDLYAFVSRRLPEVQVVPTRVWRRDYRHHECTVQRATMLLGGSVHEMLAFQHPTLATLRGALEAVGLTPADNTSCLSALRRELGWPA